MVEAISGANRGSMERASSLGSGSVAPPPPPPPPPRVGRLRALLEVQLVTADTFGTATGIAQVLGVGSRRVSDGAEKRELVERLGRDRCAVIGNGANDMLALHAAALGIAVMGREGLSVLALRSADVLCASITDALDLLLDIDALVATLRK